MCRSNCSRAIWRPMIRARPRTASSARLARASAVSGPAIGPSALGLFLCRLRVIASEKSVPERSGNDRRPIGAHGKAPNDNRAANGTPSRTNGTPCLRCYKRRSESKGVGSAVSVPNERLIIPRHSALSASTLLRERVAHAGTRHRAARAARDSRIRRSTLTPPPTPC